MAITSSDENSSKTPILEVDFDENPTELYLAICECDWDTVISTLDSNSTEAKTWVVRYSDDDRTDTLWRFLPLHSACARQPPNFIIESLIQAYPEGALCKDDEGMLPLHYACGNLASDDVISMLLIANPDSVCTKEPSGGMLPIHHVCRWGVSSPSVIKSLISVYPESIFVSDKSGKTPLELATETADSDAKEEIISTLKRSENAINTKVSPSACFQILHKHEVLRRKEANEVANQAKQIGSLMEEVLAIQSESNSLKMNHEKERNGFMKTIEMLEEEMKEKEEEMTSLSSSLSIVTSKNESLEKEKDLVENEKTCLEDEIAALKNELGNLQKDYVELKKNLENTMKFKTNAETLKGELEALASSIGFLLGEDMEMKQKMIKEDDEEDDDEEESLGLK